MRDGARVRRVHVSGFPWMGGPIVAEQPEVHADDVGGVARLGDAQDAAETRLNRLLNLVLETAVDTMLFDAATGACATTAS